MDFVRSYIFTNEPLSSWTLFSSKLVWGLGANLILMCSTAQRFICKEAGNVGAAGARTCRSLGHHLLHPQNFDRSIFIKFFYVQIIFCGCDRRKCDFGERKFFFSQVNHQSGKTVTIFSCSSTILGNKTVSTENLLYSCTYLKNTKVLFVVLFTTYYTQFLSIRNTFIGNNPFAK